MEEAANLSRGISGGQKGKRQQDNMGECAQRTIYAGMNDAM